MQFLPDSGYSAHYAYDIECYPNIFTLRATRIEDGAKWKFEISQWVNEGRDLFVFLTQVQMSNGRMVGYNNLNYDYPMIHLLMEYHGNINNAILYNKSQMIIRAESEYENFIWDRDRKIPQIDLYRIHHFDNAAKRTSLKLLEFNMMMGSIQELPYDPNYPLKSREEALKLMHYNGHDVDATLDFTLHSVKAIKFRDELSAKYGKDFTNHNDTKIGQDITTDILTKMGVKVHKSIQTIRHYINVGEILLPYIEFETPEFQEIHEFFRNAVIDVQNIKGFFGKLSAEINGFSFDFGAGGIHGSIRNQVKYTRDGMTVLDIDVEGYYPSLSIVNQFSPKHLGAGWCNAMKFMKEERIKIGKKTTLGGAYKLGGNGSYGKTNDVHSPFYDPQYTMQVTINGQLLLCMLAERLLLRIPGLEMIQANTDGITIHVPDQYYQQVLDICKDWETQTGLVLEYVDYLKMAIRDVNNYIAVTKPYIDKDGIPQPPKIKRIGAYAYERASENDGTRELPWHKNHGGVVVAKAAEAAITLGTNIESFIRNHVKTNPLDFMYRTKVNRSDNLYYDGVEVQRISRYYASTDGGYLIKTMEPTDAQIKKWQTTPHWRHVDNGKHKMASKAPSGKFLPCPPPSLLPPLREVGQCAGQKITLANELKGLDLSNVDISFYVTEARKLVQML